MESGARSSRQGRRGLKDGTAYVPKAREQVCAKAILSRRKGIQESGCVEEYVIFVEAVCEVAVPPKRINAEGSDSILADLDVPKSFMSPEAPRSKKIRLSPN